MKFSLDKLRNYEWMDNGHPPPAEDWPGWENMTDEEIERDLLREGLNPADFMN